MQAKELLTRIRREQDTFTPLQKKVATYVLENYKKIPFLSITALAENIGVSHYTVTKFCNHLGYSKFSEFKKVLSEYTLDLIIYDKVASHAPSESGDDPNQDCFEQGLADDLNAVQMTLTSPNNRQNLPQLLDMVDSARYIYLMGGRSSGYLAGLFASFLRYLNLKVFEIEPNNGDYWDRIAMIGPEDLVIAINLPRYTAHVVAGLGALPAAHVPIVLLTDSDTAPAGKYAELTFHCEVASTSYVQCYAGCLSLISALCRAISTHRKGQTAEHIHHLEKRLLGEGIFL